MSIHVFSPSCSQYWPRSCRGCILTFTAERREERHQVEDDLVVSFVTGLATSARASTSRRQHLPVAGAPRRRLADMRVHISVCWFSSVIRHPRGAMATSFTASHITAVSARAPRDASPARGGRGGVRDGEMWASKRIMRSCGVVTGMW